MSFNDIYDQTPTIRLLRNALMRNRVPNGLLFWGPSGVGKRMTALEMAKAVCCKNALADASLTGEPTADACDQCRSCQKIAQSIHPDVRVISPMKKSRIIDVEVIESINEMASLTPFEADWRVFIILEAERMGIAAQNHFLKTLEEPRGNTLFMLVSEYPRLLLPTIRSRCQCVRFGTLHPDTVVKLLRKQYDLTEEAAQATASLAQGQMSRAIDLLESDKRAIVAELIQKMAQGEDPLVLADGFTKHIEARKAQIESQVKQEYAQPDTPDMTKDAKEEMKKEQQSIAEALARRDMMEYLYLFTTWYRDEMIYATTRNSAALWNRDLAERFAKPTPGNPEKKIEAIEKARIYLERFISEDRVFRDLFFVLAGDKEA